MNYRKALIRAVTFLGGIYFFLEFVLPGKIGGVEVDQYHEQITNGFVTIGAMAVGLGLINLLMVHGSRVVFLKKGVLNSLALLIGLFAMIAVTAVDWLNTAKLEKEIGAVFMLREYARKVDADLQNGKEDRDLSLRHLEKLETAVSDLIVRLESEARPPAAGLKKKSLKSKGAALLAAAKEAAESLARLERADGSLPPAGRLEKLAESLNQLGTRYSEFLNAGYQGSLTKKIYGLLYDGLFVPLGSAMFSLLGFYMAVAAYRAFRVRSAESALMMCAAVLVMLGQIPFGIWLWEGFPDLRLWLLRVPNSAAFRGITIGAAVAGLVMAFRMWLSIESESFSKDS